MERTNLELALRSCHHAISRGAHPGSCIAAEEDEARDRLHYGEGCYFLYTVGCGPFSSVWRSQIMPSRV
jgi:hypothetical protein